MRRLISKLLTTDFADFTDFFVATKALRHEGFWGGKTGFGAFAGMTIMVLAADFAGE